ncbi:MAG: hypothetical protein AB4042_17725 [Leptolyngbyaceae cyanobacterium]
MSFLSPMFVEVGMCCPSSTINRVIGADCGDWVSLESDRLLS